MPLQLAFETFGEGPPVVILHGLFGSGRNWRGIAQALSARYRVYCVDLRNHGASPWAATMSYPEMAADVRMLIETEGLGRPVVIGHSMGGKAAMALALASPATVGRLVVVDIAPASYADQVTPYLDAMRGVDAASMPQRAEATRQLSQRVPDAQTVSFLMQNLVLREGHYDWRLNLAAIAAAVPTLCGFPAELLLRSWRGAATLIHGSLSDYVRPQHRPVIAQAFPAMGLVEVEGAGHWVHVDRPAELIAALDLVPAVEN